MTALALSDLAQGKVVAGVDKADGENCQLLKSKGAKVVHTHAKENVKDATLVVYSLATENSCEVSWARQQNIPCVSRHQYLAEKFNHAKNKIAVCGTHGKTTTTLLLCHLLNYLGQKVTCFAGATPKTNCYCADCVVVEGCEYKESFLTLFPDDVICLNVEFDHPDYFKDVKEVERSFKKFFAQSKRVFSCCGKAKEKNVFDLFEDYRYAQKTLLDGREEIEIYKRDLLQLVCQTSLPSCAVVDVFAVACYLLEKGFNKEKIAQGIESFCGVSRRWQKIQTKWCKLVVDYAHHPTQIEKVLVSADKTLHERLYVFFQPHTYTRTHALFDDFVTALSHGPFVGILPIFGARETPKASWQNLDKNLADQIAQKTECNYFCDFNSVCNFIKTNCRSNDLVLLLGAGDVDQIATLLQ